MSNKKLTALVTAFLFALSAASCSTPAEETTIETTQTVATTTAETTAATETEEPLAPVIQPREPHVFDEPAINEDNADNFRALLTTMVNAYEAPNEEIDWALNEELTNIQAVSELDYELANDILDNWTQVFLYSDYELYCYNSEDMAPEVANSGIPNSSSHAIIILGYELNNGQMQDELVSRLDAAVSLAHAYPETIILCSGGATGPNNSQGNTEAGLMRDYLVDECGIDASRVFIDESAMTTAENAINTFEMMRDNDVHSYTIVTSSYHMKWSQAVYNVVAALYRTRIDYDVQSIANYCYETEPSVAYYRNDDRFAAHQIGEIIDLPQETLDQLPSVFI